LTGYKFFAAWPEANMFKILDLFCCAGGAGMGYALSGFDVTGVDVVRHRRNPHPVIEADALALDPVWIAENFDAVHASPPCQGYTPMRHAPGAKGAPLLIGQTRELLQATGLPWVIENVEAAAAEMRSPVLLCGTMFGLGAQGHDLQRHRLFEASFPLEQPECRHTDRPVIGVYGGHARNRSAKHGGRGTADAWLGGHKAAASEALGIDWMTLGELSEAIPPAYTEWIGGRLLAHLRMAA
jgi:DNA (cytosine-5)-methyltransferase 1